MDLIRNHLNVIVDLGQSVFLIPGLETISVQVRTLILAFCHDVLHVLVFI